MLNISHIVKQSLSYDRVGDASKDLNLSVIVDQSLQAFDEKFQLGGIESKQRVRDGSGIVWFQTHCKQSQKTAAWAFQCMSRWNGNVPTEKLCASKSPKLDRNRREEP